MSDAASEATLAGPALLEMRNVGVAWQRHSALVPVLENFSLSIEAGQMTALVGESGSGKTTAALAIPRLLGPGAVLSGQIQLAGTELTTLAPAMLRRIRATRIGVIFQDPLAALNPAIAVGALIAEPIRLHLGASRAEAWARAIDLLAETGIENPSARAADYPHQFSGGMRQRVLIAAALACGPQLLIADEPTTGLDAPLKRQILDLLARLRRDRGLAVLLVSHDLALVSHYADRVHVLYAGVAVERGPARAVLCAPQHPYTLALRDAEPTATALPRAIAGTTPEPDALPPGCRFAPRCARAAALCATAPRLPLTPDHAAACHFPGAGLPEAVEAAGLPPRAALAASVLQRAASVLLKVEHLGVAYGGGGAPALARASFSLAPGECLGVVGASGSGKTTLGRAILQMLPYSGRVLLDGQPLSALRGAPLRAARRRLQVVFQDPRASLNPLLTVAELIGEALYLGGGSHAAGRRNRAETLLDQVALPATLLDRLPGTLSGGQAQRVAIARALAADPALIVLDEPTSSLDISTQAGLLALLRDLAATNGLGYIVITHDLAVVRGLAQRIAIMHRGEIVELEETDTLFRAPRHAVSAALLRAAIY